MATTFDLVVIGSGSAAISVAYPCRQAGWQVAIVDSRSFGGTCVLRGCDPKKILVGAADVIDWVRRMQGKGVAGEQAHIDWRDLMKFKHSYTDPIPAQREKDMRGAGIAAYRGAARFTSPATLQVGDEALTAKHTVIAAGAKPRPLGIPGAEHAVISDQFLDLPTLPQRITFIGGGYISLEFANLALRAGAHVTVLHRGSTLLEGFDPDLVKILTAEMRELGAAIELEAEVKGIEKRSESLITSSVRTSGEQLSVESDIVVHGAGRVPNIDGLDLPAGQVTAGPHGVAVNEYLQSVSNPAVYAIGDCADSGGPPLTPIAGYHGRTAATNLLQGNTQPIRYKGIPTIAFTIPPVAGVGLTEAKAREQGLKFRVNFAQTSGWYSSRRVNEKFSGYKVLIEEGTERILGAHLLGPHAEEIINLFALAINADMSAPELKKVIFGYPTNGSDVQYML